MPKLRNVLASSKECLPLYVYDQPVGFHSHFPSAQIVYIGYKKTALPILIHWPPVFHITTEHQQGFGSRALGYK